MKFEKMKLQKLTFTDDIKTDVEQQGIKELAVVSWLFITGGYLLTVP